MLYRAQPRYVERIWGSLNIQGVPSPVGEIWWIYHDSSGSTPLLNVLSDETTTLAKLVSGGEVPGGDRFPVLLKTLHPESRLSVQVHPGLREKGLYKEETWLVLYAEPGSWMMGGFKRDPDGDNSLVDRETFIRAVSEGKAQDLLERIELSSGDAFHIPPGTVHALGPGTSILEVQSNCDVTYRIYDWGRPGPDGIPRELHIEKGLDSINWQDPARPLRLGDGEEFHSQRLIADYSIRRVRGNMELGLGSGSIFFLTEGSAVLADRPCDSVCLISDNAGGFFRLTGAGYIIEP